MIPKVFDTRPDDHQSLQVLPKLEEDEFSVLQAFYGFELDFMYGYDRALPGQKYWAITAFELKAGPATLQPQVRDESGELITGPPGILLYLYWPGHDEFPDGIVVDPPYHGGRHGEGGFTNEGGTIGWGFGGESHIRKDPETGEVLGGPFTVWASSDPGNDPSRRVGSNAVVKLGWWDEHIIPNPIFQVVTKGGEPQPETDLLVNVNANGEVDKYIEWIVGPPPSGVEALGLFDGVAVRAHIPWKGIK
jgi:hypothetical protein